MPRIRIGNQTAISCADPLEPFHFALLNGFDAFEWFADKKEHDDGTIAGWDESDMDADAPVNGFALPAWPPMSFSPSTLPGRPILSTPTLSPS